jgi:ATP/maltotriose-dependent transcriptional regulator MalT/DNA-binding SARP family transcriptional activator
MAGETLLIETKLYPPRRRADLLQRTRLLEFLHTHITDKLLLLSAPAGYGKTTLLVDYISDLDIPVCWLSLDESDRDPVVFLDYLLATFARQFPEFQPPLPSGSWTTWGDALIARVATALVNEIQRVISDFFLVVLDDYHLVNESEVINQLMDQVLMHLPDHCQVIIASRTEPTLTPRGLALLTAQRQVSALGENQLRFTPDEVQALVAQNFDREISPEAAALLAQESEGWITGILLTAQQMAQGLLTAMAPGEGGRRRLYDYLTNEVLAQLSPDVRRFLEETAVLSEMSAELCDALRDRSDSVDLLTHIEKQNLFLVNISRDGETWYRYHHLFRDFLLARLERRDASRLQYLHWRAGDLMQARKQWDQSLQHYLKGNAGQWAAELVIRVSDEMRRAGRWQTLGQWLNLLPEDIYPSYPHLIWLKGRVLYETGAPEEAVRLFDRAYKGFRAAGERTMIPVVLYHKATALRFQGQLQASLEVLKSFFDLSEQQAEPLPDLLLVQALCEAGIVSSRLGDLEEGNVYLGRALEQLEHVDSSYDQALVYDALGSNLLESGKLTRAQIQFERAQTVWESLGSPGPLAVTLNNLGVIYSSRGEYTAALDAYKRALYEARRNGILRMEAFALAGMGDTYRDTGELDQALPAYEESLSLAGQAAETQLRVYLLDAMAETFRLKGVYAQALELARQAYEWAEEHNATLDLGRCATTLGAISYEQGRVPLALRYLDQACDLLDLARANRELGVAHLHRAQAYYQSARKQDALAELEGMVDCLLQLGYDSFLIPLATRLMPLLKYAVEQGAGGHLVADLLDRVEQTTLESSATEDLALVEPEPPLRIYGFGRSRVVIGERTVASGDWRSSTSRDLFFFLVCQGPSTKDQLVNTFWPDLSPGKLRSTFHITVYRLRRALDPLETVIFEDGRYHFNRRLNYSFDVETFEHLIVQAEALATTNPSRAIELYTQATDLYQGDFLEDYHSPHDEWRVIKASQLSERYLGAMERLSELLLQQREYQTALDVCTRAVNYDPYRESFRRRTMRCLLELGRRSDALLYYQETEQFIRDELGVSVAPETESLYQHILARNSSPSL